MDDSWTKLDPPVRVRDFFGGDDAMARPGVLVLVDYPDGRRNGQYLVGDVNENGGLCDCCSLGDCVVVARKIVWEP